MFHFSFLCIPCHAGIFQLPKMPYFDENNNCLPGCTASIPSPSNRREECRSTFGVALITITSIYFPDQTSQMKPHMLTSLAVTPPPSRSRCPGETTLMHKRHRVEGRHSIIIMLTVTTKGSCWSTVAIALFTAEPGPYPREQQPCVVAQSHHFSLHAWCVITWTRLVALLQSAQFKNSGAPM